LVHRTEASHQSGFGTSSLINDTKLSICRGLNLLLISQYNTLLRLAESAEECKKREIEVTYSGKPAGKRDYVKALQDFSLAQLRKVGKLSKGVEWIHTHITETPMLAISETQVKADRIMNIYTLQTPKRLQPQVCLFIGIFCINMQKSTNATGC
jgi:hypothetical protein